MEEEDDNVIFIVHVTFIDHVIVIKIYSNRY